MSFDQERKDHIKSYREELSAILDNDGDELVENHGFQPEDGEEPSAYDFASNELLSQSDAVSGFKLNKDYNCDTFSDNISYVVFERTTGGPNVDYVIGSLGDAYLIYNYSGQSIEKMYGDFENSPLYEMAENKSGDQFTENQFEMDDKELDQRRIAELGSDSFRQYLIDNAQPEKTEIISFEKFVYLLDDNKFDALEATRDILTAGTYTGLYASPSVDCEGFTQEDFIKIIETHIATIEKLASNYEDDFCEAISIFSIDTVDLTEINFDYLEDELKDKFNPEVKAENERKFKIKP